MRLIPILFTLAFFCVSAFSAVTVTVNGSTHTIPQTNEKGWGSSVTAWIQAISNYTLQNSGGTFTLTAEVDTGATYGFKVPYIKTQTSTPATAGVLRLAKTDVIDWRNNANGGNLPLGIDSSDRLTFNSGVIPSATSASFQDSTFSLYDNVDNTKLLAFQVSGVTTGTTRTLTAPDANTTIVGTDATQTLTNKTIAAGSNTLSGITNAHLSGSAAVSNANLAAMSANTVKANVTGGSATPTDVGLVSTNTASTAVLRDGSGNFSAGTITAALTGAASGNTTYTANQYGVVVSGSGNTMSVIAPVASTYKVLTSGGTGANPAWTLEGLSTPTTGSTFGNVAPGGSLTGLRVTAIGVSAGAANTSGADNTFLGNSAGSLVTQGGSNTIIGSQNGTATITTGQRNTIVGAGVTPGNLAATDQVLIGNGVGAAALSSNGDVVIGSLAQGNNSNQTANTTLATVSIGYSANGNASYAANDSVTIGAFSSSGGVNDVVLGSGIQSNHNDCFVVGHGGNTVSTNYVSTSAANQISFGSSTKALKDMYIGSGALGVAAPANASIQPTPVLAGNTDTAGATLTLTGGNSTGTGTGGSIIFKTAPAAGSTASTVNTMTTVGQVTSTGAWTLGAASTSPAHLLNGSLGFNGSSSGVVSIKTQAAAGTYNFNLPTTAGTSTYVLTSAGGGSSPMTWTDPSTLTSAPVNNLLINGALDWWQAGTSVTTTATGGASPVATAAKAGYAADQWYVNNILGGGTVEGIITFSQVAGTTNGSLYGGSVKITTAPTGTGIQNGTELWQTLSNKASQFLYGQTASFTVLVKALGNVNQVGCQFYYATSEAKATVAIGSEQTATVNTSTFSSCTISGQALGTSQTAAGVIGVRIRITTVSSGNTYDLNNGFVVEQAMLNKGSTAGAFARQFNDPTLELDSCLYFYEKSYNMSLFAGDSSSSFAGTAQSYGSATGLSLNAYYFKVRKRAVPTMTFYSPVGGASGKAYDRSTSTDNITWAQGDIGEAGFNENASGLTAARRYNYHWVADARL